MKPWLIALVVAVAFLGGIFAGGSFLADSEDQRPPAPVSGGAVAAPDGTPKVALGPSAGPSGGPAGPSTTPADPTTSPPGARPPRSDPGQVINAEPPPPPPPPPPAALAEGQRAIEDAMRDQDGKGDGRVTHLVYEFESEEERLAWEERRRAGWAARLAREREIKLKIMREKCGLTAAQEPRLIAILEAEGAERQRLVDALAAGTIARSSFDEQVRANVANARDQLSRLLTPEQLEAYGQLAPREQVLRDETQ